MNLIEGETVTVSEPGKPSYIAIVVEVGAVNALVKDLDGQVHCAPPDWINTWDNEAE